MCYNPIKLKNGEVVPCGKCEECYSHRRNDWSVRLQLHTLSYDRMPLFVTLTYAPEFLPPEGLKKSDIQNFIKRIRDKYDLYSTDFSYFGCGEYGDAFAYTGRGHYHVLLFGMKVYDDLYSVDDTLCRDVIEKDWSLGECFVCIAEWSGIHYVTKYVMKFLEKDWNPSQVPPFVLCSKGIGKGFMNDPQFKYIKSCVNVHKYREVLSRCPELDMSDVRTMFRSSTDIINILKPFVESCKVTLPSGKSVPLPRYYRKLLYGSYSSWDKNPFCYYRYLQRINRYSRDVINGLKNNDRVLVKQHKFAQRMFAKGHIVIPQSNFVVK